MQTTSLETAGESRGGESSHLLLAKGRFAHSNFGHHVVELVLPGSEQPAA